MGNDAIVSSDHPVYVVDGNGSSTHLTGIVQLSSGIDFTCALKNSGNVYCWGAGGYGQLGNDASTDKDHPVHVVETNGDPTSMLSDVAQIGGGQYHICAIKSSKKIFCWGIGQGGRLGDNNSGTHSVDHPVNVVTSSSDTTPHELGNDLTCKTDQNGIETCRPYIPLPTFTTGQATEDGSDSISIDLDASESLAALSFYSDQYCTQALDHTSNANPAILRNLPLRTTLRSILNEERDHCAMILNSLMQRTTPITHTRQKIAAGGSHTCAVIDEEEVLCWGRGS